MTAYLYLANPGDHMAPYSEPTPPLAVLEASVQGLQYGENGLFYTPSATHATRLHHTGGSIPIEPAVPFDLQFFSAEQRAAARVTAQRLAPVLATADLNDEPSLVSKDGPFPFVIAVAEAGTLTFYHFCDIAYHGALYLRFHRAAVSAGSLDFTALSAMLAAAYPDRVARHAILNDTCWYTRWRGDMEMERKFTFREIPDTWRLIVELYQEILDGRLTGYVPELDRDFQVFDYESHMFEVTGPAEEQGYISFIPQADGLMTVKRKWFVENAEIRRETVTDNVRLALADAEAHACTLAPGADLRRLPTFRRKRFDVNFESLRTGNIFGVYFDICRLTDHPDGPHFGQCEVEYCRSRTLQPLHDVIEEFEDVAAYIGDFLTRKRVSFRHDLYSKLDFVRDAVKAVA